ncbi:MAG: iron ABC transporter permease [Bacteroidaceae bacterium]
MLLSARHTLLFTGLIILLVIFFCLDLVFGSVSLPLKEVLQNLLGTSSNTIYHEIIFNYRLPKAITAILAGSALSLAGVLMQTLFRNPLAGPDVLGVTSGAGLGVAILTLGTGFLPSYFLSSWGLISAAIIGATLVLFLVIIVSFKIKQTVSLLIIGMMFGYFAGSIVSILQNYSNPDTLKLFIHWTFGSLSSVSWEQLKIMAIAIFTGLTISILLQKRLDALLLGDNYATTLGLSIFQTRILIILATALLAGTSTAFTGPIGFVGITIPHIARGLFRTNKHHLLLPASFLCGAILMLICDLLSQVITTQGSLPINAITAFFGAPLIIYIMIRNINIG